MKCSFCGQALFKKIVITVRRSEREEYRRICDNCYSRKKNEFENVECFSKDFLIQFEKAKEGAKFTGESAWGVLEKMSKEADSSLKEDKSRKHVSKEQFLPILILIFVAVLLLVVLPDPEITSLGYAILAIIAYVGWKTGIWL